jgi:hypothetical protein
MRAVQRSHHSLACAVTFAIAVVGCSGEQNHPAAGPTITANSDNQPPAEIASAAREAAGGQSRGLDGAKVTVHRAYDYRGYSEIKPNDKSKLIAIDVEFVGYNMNLDLDDVDIVNGQSNDNYGSDPHIIALTQDGAVAADPDDSSWPKDMGPLRTLLVYAVPKDLSSIKLSYWGHELTPAAIPVAGEGPALPQPTK